MGKGKGKSDLGQAMKIGAAKGFLKAVSLDPSKFEEEPRQKEKRKRRQRFTKNLQDKCKVDKKMFKAINRLSDYLGVA